MLKSRTLTACCGIRLYCEPENSDQVNLVQASSRCGLKTEAVGMVNDLHKLRLFVLTTAHGAQHF
eukprot:SAG31_NODE_22454_length_525_cov_0.727700_1_plen_64_part_01